MLTGNTWLRLLCIGAVCSLAAQGAMVRLDVMERGAVLNGKLFGKAGPYERIIGRARFAIDPNMPHNTPIADIALAPKNKSGLVEFAADVYMLKPLDARKGNGTVLYEVSNRGAKGMLAAFHRAGNLDPRKPEDFGDAFLLEQGYTLLWVGWQWDMPDTPGLVRLYPPVVDNVRGLVRAEWIVDQRTDRQSVGDRGHKPYTVLNPEDAALKLTVRDRVEGPRQTLPRGDWQIEGGSNVVLKGGFDPGRLYELVYTAEGSPVAGTGMAAIRDTVSWLKYGGNVAGVPFEDRYSRAIGFGISQSGRLLRTMLYYGFNADEGSRKVFDGMMADVGGAGRGGFNMRFAQPSRDSNPFFNTLTPVDLFPFTDAEQTDPETGMKDGLLTHSLRKEAWPRIFYMNSSHEYYGRAASLIHINLDGKSDAKLIPNTRVYLFTGGQHGPAAFPPVARGTRNLPSPNPYQWTFRALLTAMNDWVKDNKEPPASRYPRISAGELVPLNAVKFPKIPGVEFPTLMHLAYPANYGPDFRTKGIATQEPPEIGKPYPVMVPQVDADGIDIAGVRMPQVQVPLATYTGWNLRTKDIGGADQLFTQAGSMIPFAKTKAERMQSGDPRPSIEERYAGKDEYLKKFEAAAQALAKDGYLLQKDIPEIVKRGGAEWDFVQSSH
ncbi:MAG: alpha/beta hydrolase domain-containing protein [Bryobacteraceae bacterium]